MVIWGAEGSIDNERLEPVGLICWGGGSNKQGMLTYHVYSKDGTYDVHLTQKEFEKVHITYPQYLREQKLNKINESSE